MHFQTTACVLILSVGYASSQGDEDSDPDGKVSYEGDQVWRTILNNTKHVLEIQRLSDVNEIDVWSLHPTHVDFLVRSRDKVNVYRRLRALDMNHTILLANVQQKLDSQYAPPPMWTEDSLRLGHRLDFNSYPDMTVVEEYLNYAKDQYKSICTLRTIGRSVENRPIQMAVVSNGNPRNQAVLLVSGSHPREWIAVTSILYILNDLVARFDNQPDHVKNVDWYIIPVHNPDGYIYSHEKDRLWRKNRRPNAGSNCVGVDINRNYGKHWLVKGVTSSDPCGSSYAGPAGSSEPETRALQELIKSKKMSAFVDLHSYGQVILYPWAAISQPTPHDKVLYSTASSMKDAIFKASEKSYKTGNVYHSLYPASGTTVDFGYSEGIEKTFAIEMRDTGLHGFLLPSDQIVDTGVEIKAAVYSLAQTLTPKFRLATPGKMFIRFGDASFNLDLNVEIKIVDPNNKKHLT